MDNQFTFENKEYRDTYRHTTSHILAQAMKRLYPEVKLAIGPAIDDGFYYDFDAPEPFTPEVLEKLESEMRKICKEKLKLERFELPREEAIKFMEEREEPYKVELIHDLPEDAAISFYKQGDFVDLCAGPHLDSTGRVKGNAIKLTSVTGAYWRGDSDRKMLQRIYGTCFPKKEELDAYLARIEEAKKRDHRRLGRELGLFAFREEAPGFPFYLPKGMVLRNTLLDYWRGVQVRASGDKMTTEAASLGDLEITIAAGASVSFTNVVIPGDSKQYEDQHFAEATDYGENYVCNVLLYDTAGNSNTIVPNMMNPSTIFTDGGTYNIVYNGAPQPTV